MNDAGQGEGALEITDRRIEVIVVKGVCMLICIIGPNNTVLPCMSVLIMIYSCTHGSGRMHSVLCMQLGNLAAE